MRTGESITGTHVHKNTARRESNVLCFRQKQIGLVVTESIEKQRRPVEQAKGRPELLGRRL